MPSATGLVLAAGGITAANEVVFAPIANPGKAPEFNWRIIPATILLAIALGGLENLSGKLAQGLGWGMVLTVILAPVGNAPAPIENVNKVLGFR
jgi:hypothetical protein